MCTMHRLIRASNSFSLRTTAAIRASSSSSNGDLTEQFNAAQAAIQSLTKDPGNATKLQVYALYKQATEGQCKAPKPGITDFVGRAKWNAWSGLGSMASSDAMQQYIQLANQLAGKPVAAAAAAAAAAAETPKSEPSVKGQFKDCTVTVSDSGILTLTLNRPKKKNALTPSLYEEWIVAMRMAAEDENVKLMAVTGAGDFFCSGNDLANFGNLPADKTLHEAAEDGRQLLKRFVAEFIDFPKPLIGLINGPAVGIAVTTLGLYDYVLAADSATFHTPFSKLGQTPEACSSYTFPRNMGLLQATDVLMFNRKLVAREAQRLGLVNQVATDGEFAAESERLLADMSRLPKQTLQLSKRLIREPTRETLHRVNAIECDQLCERWTSEECIDAIMSFFAEKAKL